MPSEADLPARLRAVLAVVYLIFNEGYMASSGDALVREDLCAEAIRLGRLLAELMPDEPEVLGLLALMLLVESRRAGRTSAGGELVPLADQDRTLWDGALIAEGQEIVRRCLRRNQPGPYQIQAAINAVHSDAADRLVAGPGALRPAPGDRPEPGRRAQPRGGGRRGRRARRPALALVDALDLDGYHVFHAVRADLLRRLGRADEAAAAYAAAIASSRERGRARLPARPQHDDLTVEVPRYSRRRAVLTVSATVPMISRPPNSTRPGASSALPNAMAATPTAAAAAR